MRIRKIVLSLSLLVVLAVGGVLASASQTANEATFVSQDDVKLTIYDSSTALVQDVRTYDLAEDLNRVLFDPVPPQLNLNSITFNSLTDPDGTYAIQQNYIEQQPFTLLALLTKNIGLAVSLTDVEGNTYEGVLLSTGSEVVLQQTDGVIINLNLSRIQKYKLSTVPDDFSNEPALALLVQSSQAGEQQLALTYTATGISWAANYNLLLSSDNKSLDLTGWLSLYNGSSVAFDNAQVVLAAGDFNRLRFVSRDTDLAFATTATPSPTGTPNAYGVGSNYQAPVVQPSNFLYNIPQSISLPPNDTTLIEFLAGANADIKNQYVYDASPRIYGYGGFITDPSYGSTGVTAVLNYLEFSTDEDGLGTALPAGAMTIYQTNADGALLLVGNTSLDYTPLGETVQIFLENSADVTAERRQTAFQSLSSDALQETIEIRVRNHKTEPVEVLVPERMTRSSNWEILGSSTPFEQPDAFGVEFSIEVPAGEETVISYTVLYTQPQ